MVEIKFIKYREDTKKWACYKAEDGNPLGIQGQIFIPITSVVSADKEFTVVVNV